MRSGSQTLVYFHKTSQNAQALLNVSESRKSLTRCPPSSAASKQKLQCENWNDPERTEEFQADKSDMMPKYSCVPQEKQRVVIQILLKPSKVSSKSAWQLSTALYKKKWDQRLHPKVRFKIPSHKTISNASCFQMDFQMPGNLCKSGEPENSSPDIISKSRYAETKTLPWVSEMKERPWVKIHKYKSWCCEQV